MKRRNWRLDIAAGLVALTPGLLVAGDANSSATPAQMVITVQARHGGAAELQREDVMVYQGKTRMRVIDLQRLQGEQAGMELFVLLDDSTGTSTLGVQLPELKNFVRTLPPATRVAIGYMRNGGFSLAQGFTTGHEQAANALRLPMAVPGGNGSPYFALSYLVKHWPSTEETGRRAVLMLTDGVDRYYDSSTIDDPYVNAAVSDAQKKGVIVYSMYLHGAGGYPRSDWAIGFGQSRLIEVSEETGGYAYSEGLTNPVTLAPFLEDLDERLDHQYKLTFVARNERGGQAVTLRTEVPGLKLEAPRRVYAE